MAQAIWKQNERQYTALNDLLRKYLLHSYTPNIERQLKELFNSYFEWHEKQAERGMVENFGSETGSLQNRYALAGQLALSTPMLLPGPPDWMKPGRLVSLIKLLKDIAFDCNL
ncbi:MAG: hypothetical protein J5932_11135 [Prevotella sp.]|nr:hypothetical protein [Prevotella sp.]MBP3775962.1 hypothetical protein [Prevotella sp.]